MEITIRNTTQNKYITFNLLDQSIKIALDYIKDQIYIRKWNKDKLDITIRG